MLAGIEVKVVALRQQLRMHSNAIYEFPVIKHRATSAATHHLSGVDCLGQRGSPKECNATALSATSWFYASSAACFKDFLGSSSSPRWLPPPPHSASWSLISQANHTLLLGVCVGGFLCIFPVLFSVTLGHFFSLGF